ncbi:MAG: Rho termination factor N-terminal domain-containing protein [bacterium]|nr:Rho termination factor N-terminal domain-containing protein [bacterium]
MKIADVRKKAKEMGLKAARMKKADLIRAIQMAEGNSPCFETAGDCCDQTNCYWIDDCLPKR